MGTNGIDPRDQLIERSKCQASPTKRKYQSSEEAWEAAKYRTAESGIEIIAYACPSCGHFHLSKKVKGSDVVVKAPVGITTGALRKNTPQIEISDFTPRRELPPEGPIVPANPDARRRVLSDYLTDKEAVSSDEIIHLLSCSRHSAAKYLSEIGWKAERGPGAKWRRKTSLSLLPAPVQPTELDQAIARHPSAQPQWRVIEAFPPGVTVHDYLLTLKTVGLIVEVRVRQG